MAWFHDLNYTDISILVTIILSLPAVLAILMAVFRHRERMAMIEQGLDPDHPPTETPAKDNPANKARTVEDGVKSR
jgi:hypothetical protein